MSHICVGGKESNEHSWWSYDGVGIPLDRVCSACRDEKLAKYRPEILERYSQLDVNEPIEDEL